MTQRKASTPEFFARHPVFALEDAARELVPRGGHKGAGDRLKHHLESGRLKLLARGLYAVVPPGLQAVDLRPDQYLAAKAARSDAVFCHHSALELLGAAHSVWHECTVYTARRRCTLSLGGPRVRFLVRPPAMDAARGRSLGTRRVERRGQLLECTGPERTLVEGFRRPPLVGGHEELLLSAGGFATLELDLLEEVLVRYAAANLWAAIGWFLQRHRATFHVSDAVLARYARHVPASPQYLVRGRRGGRLHRRWNLIVPSELEKLGGPDER